MAAPIDPTRLPSESQRQISHVSQTSSSSPITKPMTPKPNSSQPLYKHQFSASTSQILDRIRNEPHGFSSALADVSAGYPNIDKNAYDNARARVMNNMATTVDMPTTIPLPPQTYTPNSSQRPPVHTNSALQQSEGQAKETAQRDMNPGVKRKREVEDEPPDFTKNTMVMPPVKPLPPRIVPVAPIVDPYGKWRVDSPRQEVIEKYRQKRIAGLPEDVVPHKPQLVGFDSNNASDYARAEYFGELKKTDVLNLLSFCDQISPGLLINVMVSITRKDPHVPIFSSPDWNANIREPAAPASQPHRPKPKPGGPRHGPSLLNSKARHKIKSRPPTVKKPHKRSRLAQEVVPGDEPEEYDEEFYVPTAWPKAGQGLYAQLPPETEDDEALVDNNDEESFSHFMVDRMGRQIVDPV